MSQSVEVSPSAYVGRGSLPMKFSLSPSAGFVSWRDTKSGSWYIETLDSIFEQWAHCEDLQTLLLRVRLVGGPVCPPQGRWWG